MGQRQNGHHQRQYRQALRRRDVPGLRCPTSVMPLNQWSGHVLGFGRPAMKVLDAAGIERKYAEAIAGIIEQPDFRSPEGGRFAIQACRWRSRHEFGWRGLMSAMAFDTRTAAKRLRDAGFSEHQAEAAVMMVRSAVGADQEARATRADVDAAISALESRLTAHMDTFATEAVNRACVPPALPISLPAWPNRRSAPPSP